MKFKLLFLLLINTVMGQAFNWVSIVSDKKFSDSTDYFKFYENFYNGMEFSKLGDNAKNCKSYFQLYLDDFNALWLNHTSTDSNAADDNTAAGNPYGASTWRGQENVFLKVTWIFSGHFQQSFQYCTLFMNDLQEKYYNKKEGFKGLIDYYTSFLLNFMSKAY